MQIENIKQAQYSLYQHPVIKGGYINNIRELRIFMEHHVFAVWDFMSLIKSMQHEICPSTNVWIPTPYAEDGTARLVNDIVMAEESDETPDGRYLPHYNMYIEAMNEVGADTLPIRTFLNNVVRVGVLEAIEILKVEYPVQAAFVGFTFEVISLNSLPYTTSCFAFGRETSIPDMFQGIVEKIGLDREECPMFIYYLERHIELDGDDHGPKAIELVKKFSGQDPEVIQKSENVAINSITARSTFFDGIQQAIVDSRPAITKKVPMADKTTEQVQEAAADILFPSNATRRFGQRF